ncbi:MAG: hypothetical protein KFB93_05865 [Simkaniaceae bacterium]|nr:MAG: hypothetical protein KFB93_05865 [Simkaniaceae bacterium]
MKKIILILIISLVGFGGFYFYTHTNKPQQHKLNFHHVVKGVEFKKWVNFNPKDENFSASFPKKPKSNSRDLPIPGSDGSIPYKEFICEMDGDIHFSVSYTTLPEGWLKYGNSLVLGGALKVIMQELGKSELVGTEKGNFKTFPALDYEHYTVAKENQMESAGTLVLVGNVLYKVEMTYPLELHNQVQDQLANFIENFAPEKVEVISSQPESSASDTLQSPQ